MLLLVFLYEGVPELARFDVHFCAHRVRSANIAGVPCFPLAAPGCWLVFYQSFFYQTVPIVLISRKVKKLDAALKKATLLSTGFRKLGLLLEN